jgi:hypothetical protein
MMQAKASSDKAILAIQRATRGWEGRAESAKLRASASASHGAAPAQGSAVIYDNERYTVQHVNAKGLLDLRKDVGGAVIYGIAPSETSTAIATAPATESAAPADDSIAAATIASMRVMRFVEVDGHTEYEVGTWLTSGVEWNAAHRYSDFLRLHRALPAPCRHGNAFPPKRLFNDDDVKRERLKAFDIACAVLCCAVLCCATLRYAMLCYAMRCYATLCCAMLCYAMLCDAMKAFDAYLHACVAAAPALPPPLALFLRQSSFTPEALNRARAPAGLRLEMPGTHPDLLRITLGVFELVPPSMTTSGGLVVRGAPAWRHTRGNCWIVRASGGSQGSTSWSTGSWVLRWELSHKAFSKDNDWPQSHCDRLHQLDASGRMPHESTKAWWWRKWSSGRWQECPSLKCVALSAAELAAEHEAVWEAKTAAAASTAAKAAEAALEAAGKSGAPVALRLEGGGEATKGMLRISVGAFMLAHSASKADGDAPVWRRPHLEPRTARIIT